MEEKPKATRKRLQCWISPEEHRRVKIAAARSGMGLEEFERFAVMQHVEAIEERTRQEATTGR